MYSSDGDASEDGFEQRETIARAEERIDRSLGVRHHPENVSRLVDDAGDGPSGAVGAPPFISIGRTGKIPKYDPAFALQSVDRLLVRRVTPVTMGNGNPQRRALFVAVREQCVRGLNAKAYQLTHELEARVAQQRAREQPGFAGDLKSVADGEHRPAAVREGDDVLHHGAEPRDRAGTQVITVTEAAGQDDHVAVVQVVMLVPEKGRPFAESVDDGTVGVVVAVRAGKGDDAELHAASTVAISKSSVTGFASRRSHMARASRSADCWSPASSSST